MSLATRCIHCGTIFKVVQDQLKVSEGWVRCGRCNDVFNALPGLFDIDKEPPPPRPSQVMAPPPEPVFPPEPAAPATNDLLADAELNLGLETKPPVTWTKPDPTELIPPPSLGSATDFELDTSIAVDDNTPLEAVLAATAHTAPSPSFPPSPPSAPPAAAPEHPEPWLDTPPQDVPRTDESDALDSRYLMPMERERRAPKRPESTPDFADAQFPVDAMLDAAQDWSHDTPPAIAASSNAPEAEALTPQTASATRALATEFKPDFKPERAVAPPRVRSGRTRKQTAPHEPTPGFLKQARRKAFWHHPATRTVLSLMLLSLCLTLGLQLLHQFRDLIAAWHPASRPLLTQWCDLAGCKLAPPLRLEAMQVDNLSLMRTTSEGPDSYRLTVVIRNQAPIEVAWPAVDLTLTDNNGAVIARRMFSPNEAQWLDTADASAHSSQASSNPVAANLPDAAPSQRSTTLQWQLHITNLRPAGYTAELFYP